MGSLAPRVWCGAPSIAQQEWKEKEPSRFVIDGRNVAEFGQKFS